MVVITKVDTFFFCSVYDVIRFGVSFVQDVRDST